MIDLKKELEEFMRIINNWNYSQQKYKKAVIDFAEKVAKAQKKADGGHVGMHFENIPLVTDTLKEDQDEK